MSMNVSLPSELEKLVQAQVKSGLFSSASEVVRHALRETFLPAKTTDEDILDLLFADSIKAYEAGEMIFSDDWDAIDKDHDRILNESD